MHSLQNKKKHLQKLMHDNQTSFLKGRYIGENINRLLGTMKIIDKENIPAIRLTLTLRRPMIIYKGTSYLQPLMIKSFDHMLKHGSRYFTITSKVQ